MNKIKSCALVLFLIILHTNTNAQSSADSIRKENINMRIALADIIGDWFVEDSLNSKISFVNPENLSVQMVGIMHGVWYYSFVIEEDSIKVNGYAPNWPPYYCSLSMMSKNTLVITFYSYTYPNTTSIICRRE